MSSHKGYGLAMMAQILGSTLTGSGSRPGALQRAAARATPTTSAISFLALNPDTFPRCRARSRRTWTK